MPTPVPTRVIYSSEVAPWKVVDRRMEDLGLNQQDVARIAFEDYGIEGRPGSGKPIAAGLISQIINGNTWPPPTRPLIAVCVVLGLSFDQLGLDKNADRPAYEAIAGYRMHQQGGPDQGKRQSRCTGNAAAQRPQAAVAAA